MREQIRSIFEGRVSEERMVYQKTSIRDVLREGNRWDKGEGLLRDTGGRTDASTVIQRLRLSTHSRK